MTRNKFCIFIFIIIIATAVVLNVYQRWPKFTDIKIGSYYYHLEIADTFARRVKGLSGRDFLDKESGMLFLFPFADRYVFTTKNMKFPIDIIWLNGNKIVDLTPNAPPNSSYNFLPRLPINRVIELNAGTIQKESLKIGDVVGE